jgi:prepilin-type N-terminal cleavage/methylation domain-containing protein
LGGPTGGSTRRGFSFIELLVAVAIVGVLVALLLPAVGAVREAARRNTCNKNLAQLILAVHNYQNLHGLYPPGTIDEKGPIRSVAQGYHHNWIVQILPYLEQRNVWEAVNQRVGVYDPANAPVAQLRLEVLQCPSQPKVKLPMSCYAGVHHDREAPIDVNNNGVFFLNSRVRYEDVTDGSSQTIFIGEIVAERGGLGWMSGTRATLRNAGFGGLAGAPPVGITAASAMDDAIQDIRVMQKGSTVKIDPLLIVGSFASMHPGGAQFAFGDGRAGFLSGGASPQILMLLANRSDGKLLDGESY